MNDHSPAPVDIVTTWLALFDRRLPTEDELRALLHPDVTFIERPSLVSPHGGQRDLQATLQGAAAGRQVLRWQRYEVRDHLAAGTRVATRMRWTGELAISVGELAAGTTLTAWRVGHFDVEDGLIRSIEQHDCYEPPPR